MNTDPQRFTDLVLFYEDLANKAGLMLKMGIENRDIPNPHRTLAYSIRRLRELALRGRTK